MGDKFDGAFAGGGVSTPAAEIGVAEALQDLSLHETLVTEDNCGNITLLRAVQNPYYGGVMVVGEPGEMDSFAMMEAIKLSQMTSMLNDDDRCSKYARAISMALKENPGSRVLDIGSGTGLLAMLAARAGAHHVDAVEMFKPMADLAVRIVRDNELQAVTTVHAARSTELVVKRNGNGLAVKCIEEKADILVTEIFDSALLGEGCLPVIAHASTHLLKEKARVIPAKAVLRGVVICSEFAARFHDLGSNFSLHRSEDAKYCAGGGKGIPIHFDALEEGRDYNFLSEEISIFEFAFLDGEKICSERTRTLQIARTRKGIPSAILTWWELDLTGKGDNVYSSKSGVENWQDHWLPVLYPLCSGRRRVSDDGEILISAAHDQMSLWFAFGNDMGSRLSCSCGYHALPGGPYRIFEIGCQERLGFLTTRIHNAVKKAYSSRGLHAENKPIRCIDISDSSLCGILATQLDSEQKVEVLSVEEDSELSAFLYEQVSSRQKTKKENILCIEHNPLSAVVERESTRKSEIQDWQGFDVILSEPYTRAMWAYPLATLANLIVQRNALAEVSSAHVIVVPEMARIKAQVLRFADNTLQRAFGAVDNVQGFDHECFAELYDDWPGSERISLPLFQYVPARTSAEVVLRAVDLCTLDGEALTTEKKSIVTIGESSRADAVGFWVEYDGEAVSRVGRSEVMWLDEETRTTVSKGGKLEIKSVLDSESGTFKVTVSAPE